MAMLKRQKSSIYGLENDLSTLTSDIASETSRASSAESSIAASLANEVSRAGAAESTITSNLNAEISRATAAEGSIASDLASEVSRATAAEGAITSALNAEVSRATASEGTITSNLNAEVSRATAAEGSIASDLASEVSRATAAEGVLQGNIDTVVAQVNSLGSAFNYIGVLEGGADEASAFDMATVASEGKDAGDYYKVSVAGYFKVGTGSAFYANVADGLVWNLDGGVDKIDNTNSQVFGTTNFIAVSGSTDTGFYVDVDSTFKGRVDTLESGLSAEISRAGAAESSIASDLASEVSRAGAAESSIASDLASEVSRATAAEGSLDSAKMSKAANGSDIVDIATFRTNIDVYSVEEVDAAIAAQSNQTTNASAIISNDKVTFAKAPVGGVDGIAFASVRVFGVVPSNPEVYDECQVSSVDGTDASGKTFNLAPDVAGAYDGKSCQAFIVYNPSI